MICLPFELATGLGLFSHSRRSLSDRLSNRCCRSLFPPLVFASSLKINWKSIGNQLEINWKFPHTQKASNINRCGEKGGQVDRVLQVCSPIWFNSKRHLSNIRRVRRHCHPKYRPLLRICNCLRAFHDLTTATTTTVTNSKNNNLRSNEKKYSCPSNSSCCSLGLL